MDKEWFIPIKDENILHSLNCFKCSNPIQKKKKKKKKKKRIFFSTVFYEPT